jgi:pimeloyl-ACP methyl ester carboxylesterase
MIQTVNGVDLWYEKTGDGPPILLLHGNGESHKIFRVLTEQLSQSFTVYALDSRDHGQSGKSRQLSYDMMTEDVRQFIEALGLDKPVLYGFSDGGILGLMLASRHPDLLSKLIVSGANTYPGATKKKWLALFSLIYFFTWDEKFHLMLTGPRITAEELGRIKVPVLVLAGGHDMIREDDTRHIAAAIPGAVLRIVEKEGHMSYVINSPKLYPLIEDFLKNA